MGTYSVTTRGLPAVEVLASNWMVALGLGIDRLGVQVDIERLACEVLPNGTVIAREIRSGMGFVVETVFEEEEEDEEAGDVEVLVGGAVLLEAEDPLTMRLKTVERAADREEACKRALEIAQDLIPAESGAIILVQGSYHKFLAVAGPHAAALRGLLLPVGSGVVGFCIDSRRPLVLDDVAADSRHFREIDELTGYRTRDLACIPTVHGEEVFGVIEMLNLPEGDRFDRKSVFALQAISEVLARRMSTLLT